MTEQESYEFEFSEPLGEHPDFHGQCLRCGLPDDPGHTCLRDPLPIYARSRTAHLFEQTFERVNDRPS